MSADNWGLCPKCQDGLDPATYEGKFLLREEWELGIFRGKFYVIYDGECSDCEYKFHYEHEEKV